MYNNILIMQVDHINSAQYSVIYFCFTVYTSCRLYSKVTFASNFSDHSAFSSYS